MVAASPDDDNIVRRMNHLLMQSNVLQDRLVEDNLIRHRIWQATEINNLPEQFPILSLDDIRSLTLGIKLF